MKPVMSAIGTRKSVESINAEILSWGTVRAWPEQLAGWRKQPAPMPPEPFSPSLIRHSDDQTVAALWAACEATRGMDATHETFSNWGVIAAPRLMGRSGNAASFERFAAEGPWGISPNVIPHQSLHAISGTISQIFKTHGPNFGVGNGPGTTCEGWLTAATLLSEGCPGLLLTIVGHTGEFIPTATKETESPRLECEAVALALVPATASARSKRHGLHLRICPEEILHSAGADASFLDSLPEYSLSQLVDELAQRDAPPTGIWRLPGAGWIEIEMR